MGRYSRALQRELTESEMTQPTDKAVAVIGEWKYNNCDICINPHEQGFAIGDMYAYVSTAQGHNRVWNFGERYSFGSRCGGCGVLCPLEGYATEEAARDMGWRCLLTMAEKHLKELKFWEGNPQMENKGEREQVEKMIAKINDMLMPTFF